LPVITVRPRVDDNCVELLSRAARSRQAPAGGLFPPLKVG